MSQLLHCMITVRLSQRRLILAGPVLAPTPAADTIWWRRMGGGFRLEVYGATGRRGIFGCASQWWAGEHPPQPKATGWWQRMEAFSRSVMRWGMAVPAIYI